MWVVAALGMATAFTEATPAQLFNLRSALGPWVAMALMALVKLIAITLLGKWAFGAFTDYQRQESLGQNPTFVADGNTDLPGELPGDVWDTENGHTFASGG